MSLSKPQRVMYQLLGSYILRLYTSPVKTKAITSCIIAILGNVLHQKISGRGRIDKDMLLAFGLFGLIFGGPAPHYFYAFVQPYVRNPVMLLAIERLVYTPCFHALALYVLSRFKGNSHKEASKQLAILFWPTVYTNLKYLTLLQYINMKLVPTELRVLVGNLIGFFWTIFHAQQERAKVSKRIGGRKC